MTTAGTSEWTAETGAREHASRVSPADLTVAICTRGRPESLRRAIGSVLGLAVPGELLVIDNAPDSTATREMVERDYPDVRYLVEPSEGLDFARNRALRSASFPIVVFLDDDAVACDGWLEAIADRFDRDAGLAACTSRVDALSLDDEGARIFEANGGFPRHHAALLLPRDLETRRLRGRRVPAIVWVVSSGCGCGLAVDRDAALRIGGFDDALDLGRVLPGGGDHDLLWRLYCGGDSIGYEPSAVVRHEHRPTPSEAYDQIVGHQRALSAFLVKSALRTRGRRRLQVVAFLGWRLVKPGIRLVRSLTGRDALPAVVAARMWIDCWIGIVMYPRARRMAALRRGSP